MRRTDYFIQVEQWWLASGMGWHLPGTSERAHILLARVDEGRWVVDCPVPTCGDAKVIAQTNPIYICHVCGSEANNRKWYDVRIPRNWQGIQVELLRNPAPRAFYAVNRNWTPGQTIADLTAERRTQGRTANRGAIKAGDSRLEGLI